MKTLLRTAIFCYISLILTQTITNAFLFTGIKNYTLLLVLGALTLLNLLSGKLFAVLGLPSKGVGMLILMFFLSLCMFYMLTLFVPDFMVIPAKIVKLNIFGFVLPSKSLTRSWSLVFATLLFVVFTSFFNWLVRSKK